MNVDEKTKCNPRISTPIQFTALHFLPTPFFRRHVLVKTDNGGLALASPWSAPEGRLSYRGTIPEIVISHEPREFRDWKERIRRWKESGRSSPELMGRYESLVRGGRMPVFQTEHSSYGWPEAYAAVTLEDDGWRCWTGVQLFTRNGRSVQSRERARVTDEVKALFEQSNLPFPRPFGAGLDFTPKNPDLVCFHPQRKAWRFCEVKRDEPVQPGQANALAFLHWLTRASVAIIRVVPEGSHPRHRTHPARFTFTGPSPLG